MGRSHMFFRGKTVGSKLVGQIGGYCGSRADVTVKQKRQLLPPGLGDGLCGRVCLDHKGRIGAVKALRGQASGLQKAGIVAGVEHQRLAFGGVQAGPLAGVDVGVEDRGQIALRQVGIVPDLQPLGRDQRVSDHRKGHDKGKRQNCQHPRKTHGKSSSTKTPSGSHGAARTGNRFPSEVPIVVKPPFTALPDAEPDSPGLKARGKGGLNGSGRTSF